MFVYTYPSHGSRALSNRMIYIGDTWFNGVGQSYGSRANHTAHYRFASRSIGSRTWPKQAMHWTITNRPRTIHYDCTCPLDNYRNHTTPHNTTTLVHWTSVKQHWTTHCGGACPLDKRQATLDHALRWSLSTGQVLSHIASHMFCHMLAWACSSPIGPTTDHSLTLTMPTPT